VTQRWFTAYLLTADCLIAVRATRIYPQCPHQGICSQLFHPAMLILLITQRYVTFLGQFVRVTSSAKSLWLHALYPMRGIVPHEERRAGYSPPSARVPPYWLCVFRTYATGSIVWTVTWPESRASPRALLLRVS
jgi:hypothetical protein